MRQRLLETVGRSARLRVLNELKRSSAGLAVKEIAARLGMSYMGVKDLCVDLHQRGLLVTWRQPQRLGRPLMVYRLTDRAHELFPAASNALTLELLQVTQKIYGASAPEKLLLHVFHGRTERYKAQIRGDTLEKRAESLARLRDAEGCMCELITGGNHGNGNESPGANGGGGKTSDGGLAIVEHHSPLLDVLEAYPIVGKLEAEMFQAVLGVPVKREEERVAGLFRARFILGAEK